jgi:hypothetical protein
MKSYYFGKNELFFSRDFSFVFQTRWYHTYKRFSSYKWSVLNDVLNIRLNDQIIFILVFLFLILLTTVLNNLSLNSKVYF